MKSKPRKQPEKDIELDEEEELEIDAGGPEIASSKKSKIAVIVASTLLTIFVVYIFFLRDNSPKENLEPVQAPRPVNVAPSDNGKSPFVLEAPKEESTKTDVDLLAKPETPDLPTLPELPKDAVLPDKIDLSAEQKTVNLQENNLPKQAEQPNNQAQNQLQQQNAQQQNQAPATLEKKVDPRYAPIMVFSGLAQGATVPSRSVGYDNNIVALNKNPIDSLQNTTTAIVATKIADMPHTIAQGKLITAVLETAINTELPGSVRAVVSRDVYGESGNEILIPKGSRLFGSYSSRILRGQGRVEIGWTRLIRPDGVDMAITFNAADQFGRSGLPGEVDNRYSSIVTSSMLTSVLAVGGVAAAQRLLTNNNINTVTTNPTQGTTTTTGSATNQALYDVTKTIIDTVGQLISNTLDLTPIIRVPQGTRITVIANADITIPSARR